MRKSAKNEQSNYSFYLQPTLVILATTYFPSNPAVSLNKLKFIDPLKVLTQVSLISPAPNPTIILNTDPAKHPVKAINPNPILANLVSTKKSQELFPKAKNVIPKYEKLISVKVCIN